MEPAPGVVESVDELLPFLLRPHRPGTLRRVGHVVGARLKDELPLDAPGDARVVLQPALHRWREATNRPIELDGQAARPGDGKNVADWLPGHRRTSALDPYGRPSISPPPHRLHGDQPLQPVAVERRLGGVVREVDRAARSPGNARRGRVDRRSRCRVSCRDAGRSPRRRGPLRLLGAEPLDEPRIRGVDVQDAEVAVSGVRESVDNAWRHRYPRPGARAEDLLLDREFGLAF